VSTQSELPKLLVSTQFVLREFKNSLKHRSLDKVNPQETFIDLLGIAVEMFSHRDSF
jgi:hypothetical protein